MKKTLDYGALAADLISQSAPMVAQDDPNFRGLLLYFALYTEALNAASQVRGRTRAAIKVEWVPLIDRVSLTLNLQYVAFQRMVGSASVQVFGIAGVDTVEASTPDEARDLAAGLVGSAVTKLIKTA